MKPKLRTLTLTTCLLFTTFTFIHQMLPRWHYVNDYVLQKEECQMTREALDAIPKDASIASNTFYVPYLSKREEIYMIDDKILDADNLSDADKLFDTEYAVFDLRTGYGPEKVQAEIELYEENGYELVDSEDDLYVILLNRN